MKRFTGKRGLSSAKGKFRLDVIIFINHNKLQKRLIVDSYQRVGCTADTKTEEIRVSSVALHSLLLCDTIVSNEAKGRVLVSKM